MENLKLRTKMIKKSEAKVFDDVLEIKSKISKAIIERRAKENLTQKELAEQIGVSQSAIFRFESGVVNPRWGLLKKVTTGLGLRLMVK